MKKLVTIIMVLSLISTVACNSGENSSNSKNNESEAPMLYAQNAGHIITALQLTTSWSGGGLSYQADSPDPLQLSRSDYANATIILNGYDGEIKLKLSKKYMSEKIISVKRWRAEYATGNQDTEDVLDKFEVIEVNGNTISVSDDGYDYIYEVIVTWSARNSRSYYAFHVVSSSATAMQNDVWEDEPEIKFYFGEGGDPIEDIVQFSDLLSQPHYPIKDNKKAEDIFIYPEPGWVQFKYTFDDVIWIFDTNDWEFHIRSEMYNNFEDFEIIRETDDVTVYLLSEYDGPDVTEFIFLMDVNGVLITGWTNGNLDLQTAVDSLFEFEFGGLIY